LNFKKLVEDIYKKVVDEEISDLNAFGGKEALKQFIISHTKGLAAKGIDAQKTAQNYINSGLMGSAFKVGDGTVLKVTTDKKEAGTSFYLSKKGGNLKHVVKIFDVFRFGKVPEQIQQKLGDADPQSYTKTAQVSFKTNPERGVKRVDNPTSNALDNIYGIHQEELTPISKAESGEIDKLYAHLFSNGAFIELHGIIKSGNIIEFERALEEILITKVLAGENIESMSIEQLFPRKAGSSSTAVAKTQSSPAQKPTERITAPLKQEAPLFQGSNRVNNPSAVQGTVKVPTGPMTQPVGKTSMPTKSDVKPMDPNNASNARRAAQNKTDEIIAMIRKYKLDEMMKELSQLQVEFYDYHGGNVMKNKSGEYVITDLGISEVPETADPPVLPEILRKLEHKIFKEIAKKSGHSRR
jgi:hypothetical protein